MKKIVCCGILRQEMEQLVQDKEIAVKYLDAALHVDFDRLKDGLTGALADMAGEDITLIIGSGCHPDMESIAADHGARLALSKNCIEMLLGEQMKNLDSEAKTFYITGGWLENWRSIFIGGLKWDRVDARQNFGSYDRVLMLDTGLSQIDDEKILEFYDFTGVPVEIMPVGLDNLRIIVEKTLAGED